MIDSKKRIEIIDAARGLSVVLMVIHHLLYNLAAFVEGMPEWLYTNPVFDVLSIFFAGLFIFLSGVSSRFSRGNKKRGLKVLAIAAAISAVTYFMGMPIWFGILHLLGFSMLFFGLTHKFWNLIPRVTAPVIYIAGIVAGRLATSYVLLSPDGFAGTLMSLLGWRHPEFYSYDYFPVLPWLFVFLLGTWAGLYILDEKLPGWFYEAKFPFFPKVGRKALLIYVLHQPVLYPLAIGVNWVLGRF